MPRFFIETIAVEGAGLASSGIVVSESLLEEGRGYSEAALREAVYRVHRLPFVVDAGFALGKGSERGRYRLLITVEEVETFFFGGDLVYSDFGGALAASPALDDGFNDSLTVGARLFAGQGVFFAAVGDGEDLQAGYTRYRLFGRPMLLRLAYSREECCSVTLHELGLDPATGTWTAVDDSDRLELTLGLPLGGNHSLRLDASRLDTGSATRRPLDATGSAFDASDVEQQEIELAWVYDTTDDPLFPTRGDAMTAGIGLRRFEGALSPRSVAGSPPAATEMSSRLVGLSLYGARHWPLSARQTASLSLKLLLSRSQVEHVPVQGDVPVPAEAGGTRFMSGDVDALEADLGVRYSLALWGNRKIRRWGELRWETVASLIYVETSPAYEMLHQPLWGVSASSTLALRNSWGVFRIGFAILDFDGDL